MDPFTVFLTTTPDWVSSATQHDGATRTALATLQCNALFRCLSPTSAYRPVFEEKVFPLIKFPLISVLFKAGPFVIHPHISSIRHSTWNKMGWRRNTWGLPRIHFLGKSVINFNEARKYRTSETKRNIKKRVNRSIKYYDKLQDLTLVNFSHWLLNSRLAKVRF